ncbi:hypothetical protein EDD85DRAFT_962375 [Armillaria nabsnona]|nr:hypothetical protein EDD85DRAFT_962375 [Armillaria nabsnona]
MPQPEQPLSSGFRFPLDGSSPFPPQDLLGPPPCHDWGNKPVYIGSAIRLRGREIHFKGRFDLLPFNPEMMEIVRTSEGRIPDGRRPIKGGYEEDGLPLHHGVAEYKGYRVPGKTSPHLNGCIISFDWSEHLMTKNYEILCV